MFAFIVAFAWGTLIVGTFAYLVNKYIDKEERKDDDV